MEFTFEKDGNNYKIAKIKFDEDEEGRMMFEIDDFYLH